MSVLLSELILYGSANMPEADSVTVGGAVDFTKQVVFTDLAANGTISFVSSSALDMATKIQVNGRDATGFIQAPAAVTLTGTTKVVGGLTFERLNSGVITGGAIGTLTNPVIAETEPTKT
jgi:hypothetical protein